MKPAKREHYLQLAQLLLDKVPTESVVRSVQFLVARLPSNAFCFAKPHSSLPLSAAKVKICGDQQPGELASLPWFEKVSCHNQAVSSLISSSSVFVLGGEGGSLNTLLRPPISMTSTCSCHPLWQNWLR